MKTILLAIAALLVAAGASLRAQEPSPTAKPSLETIGPAGPAIIMNLADIAAPSATPRLLGREVAVRDVCVDRVGESGFWVSVPGGSDQVFVVPAEGSLIRAEAGTTVSIQGQMRLMTAPMRTALYRPFAWDEVLYLYGYLVRPAWPVATASHPAGCLTQQQ